MKEKQCAVQIQNFAAHIGIGKGLRFKAFLAAGMLHSEIIPDGFRHPVGKDGLALVHILMCPPSRWLSLLLRSSREVSGVKACLVWTRKRR